MATFTTYRDGRVITASSGSNAAGAPSVDVLVGEFDATQRPLAAADVATVINIPAGTWVQKVFVIALTGEAAQTINVGDGADPDGYVAAADVGTTGNRAMGAGALAAGKYYTAADTIDIEVPATKAFATLKVRVVAVVCRTS